jgi:hypothetical protein
MTRPASWLHGKDLDIGQSKPTDLHDPGNLKMLAGQHRLKLGRREGTATAHPGNPGIAAWAAAEEIPKHDHPGRAEHSGGLDDASRQVRPVAERHGGEHQIEAGVGKSRRSARAWTYRTAGLLGVAAMALATIRPARSTPTKLQGPVVNGNEQELLQHTVVVGARPKVESARGWTRAAHESALMVGGRQGGWSWRPISRAPSCRQSSR